MFEKWKGTVDFAKNLIGVLVVIGPIGLWVYHSAAAAADVKAQAYIQRVVDQRFNDLSAQVGALRESNQSLENSINRLIRGQSAESTQSADEARIGRQILCLQQLQIDPSSGTTEGCMSLQ